MKKIMTIAYLHLSKIVIIKHNFKHCIPLQKHLLLYLL